MLMDTVKTCQHCGKPITPKAAHGLCPECLMQVGLGTVVNPGDTPASPASSAGFVPPEPAQLAAHFPQLEILELIGHGGMGAVYRTRQKQLDRVVALKILPPDVGSDPSFTERFAREAKSLAKLNHPGIVTLYEFGQADAFFYFLMEYVDGVNLRQLLHTGRIPSKEALAIVPQVCEALQFAHDRGIVHRDIKPENILLGRDGQVKIADFGIAKLVGTALASDSSDHSDSSDGPEPARPALTAAGALGTPGYMAPEQVEHPQAVDHRADIYSLGVVFYQMLTGELPVGKFAPPSRRVQVDVRLDEIVLRALEQLPERRYQQASQVKTAVETIALTSSQQPLTRETETNMNTHSKTKLWFGLAIGAACVAIGIAAWMLLAGGKSSPSKLTQEGWQLWQARQLNEATAKFQQAVKLAPHDANAWNGLGWTSFNSGKYQDAETAFQKVLELEPSHPAALNGLGQLNLTRRQYEQAETYLLKAAPQAPAAWFGLARLYLLQGKFEQAEEWARKLVDSGQADDTAKQMLDAAKSKQIMEGLRLRLEPPPAAGRGR
ncbi:MAG: protein kinase [Verrucomicrobia bacterium]|nr:protein kinase [Verrucomicrobiota bacterium]